MIAFFFGRKITLKIGFLRTLSGQIFIFFWLTFTLLIAAIFFIPYLDSRIYSELSENEFARYQKEIITSIRSNQIGKILAGTPLPHVDILDSVRPVLVDQEQNVLGAREDELPVISRFILDNVEIIKPLKKTAGNIQVAGPFSFQMTNQQGDEIYRLYFVARVNPQRELLTFIFDHPAALIMLISMISTPLLWWLARRIGKPIAQLQLAANAIAVGNFKTNQALEREGSIELRQVGRSFNRMANALEELLSGQQVLLSSISHELKTPLTRLQLAIGLLRRKLGDSAEVNRIEMEAERLDKMIHDLLLLSRQQLNSHLIRDIFPIDELWSTLIEDAIFEAEQNNLTFEFVQTIKSPKQYFINGNKSLLISAIENIIRNALKYTNTHIEVMMSIEQNQLCILVQDNGKGLPATEYEKIFKPFYRVDETRTRETGGTGLGLAIVEKVVNEHSGTVTAGASRLGGLCITLNLPLWINT